MAKSRDSKSSKPKKAEIYRELADIINGESSEHIHLPKRYFTVEVEPGFRRMLREYEKNCVAYVDDDALVHELIKYIGEYLSGSGIFALTVNHVREAVEYWIAETTPIPMPAMIAERDFDGLCFLRLPFNYLDPGEAETPTFDEFLGRCQYPDAIRAFVGSCFIEDSNRQQYLWLYGAGGDGKGSFVNAIAPIFKEFFKSTVAPKNGAVRFWTHTITQARVVCFPDNNSYGFINDGLFKACTGDDVVPCEIKGGKVYDAKLKCKFIFLSNEKPDIDGSRASLRRAIYSEVKEPEGCVTELSGDYAESMNREAVGFVRKCIKYYLKSHDRKGVIAIDVEALGDLVSFNEEYFEYVFNTYFETNVMSNQVPAHEVTKRLIAASLDRFQRREFFSYMERTKKVYRKRLAAGAFYVGLKIKFLTTSDFNEIPPVVLQDVSSTSDTHPTLPTRKPRKGVYKI